MTKILINEAVVRQALEALELHGEQYPHMVKGYCLDAIADLRQALEQPAPAQPLTPGFAGVTLWLGDARVTQIVTEAQIRYERETGQALTEAAQKCLDIYAGARGTKGGA